MKERHAGETAEDTQERLQNKRHAGETAGGYMFRLNLKMFDGEAAAEASGESAEGTVIYGKPAEESNPENHVASEEDTAGEGREAAFEALIKGEYKDLYDARMQGELSRRFKTVEGLKNQLQNQKEIMDLIGLRYGVDAADINALKKAMDEDSTYWEEAAEREGLTVEQYKKIKRMEAENAELKRAKQEQERLTQRNETFSRWNSQAEELKTVYPNFNLESEIQNEQFVKLLGAGIDMRTAYEAINHDRLMEGAMAFTAQKVAKQQADAIRSGQARPTENGVSSRAAATVKRDPAKLTTKDFREIERRVAAGERISF